MAKSTKNARRLPKKGNYKRVTTYKNGGNVSELNYSERREYIEKNYAPLIEEASMLFTISGSQFAYDYKGDRNKIVDEIIEHYTSISDYTEKTLPQETIYEIQDWDLVRKEIDPENDEVIGETTLEEVSADNSYNFSYLGLVDLNWRVYYDDLYERYFYVIMPHLGGDIRGNYGDAFILEGNDKDELFYRFYEEFLLGFAVIYFSFKDGSEIGFDSEQDSDVFYFRENEVFEPTGIAQKYLNDFEKFDTWYGDEFLEETIDVFLMQKGVAPKMMAGGDIYSDTPKAYIEVLGYDEGKWIDLTDYTDGMDVIDNISDWMSELNQQFGGNREEFRVADFEGFGNDLYDEYMGSNEFDEIIEAYEKFKSSDFPVDVISAYRTESGSKNDTLGDVIDEMENNYFGKYDSYTDFGYEMVEQGVYEPSDYDVYITETDKRIVAGEEADYVVGDMDFEEVLKFAKRTNAEYEDEKSELEDKIVELQEEIRDLTVLQNDTENDQEYETISDEIEAKEIELEEAEDSYRDIDSRYEDNARQEAITVFYDEIYDRLDNDLSSWLEDNGYTDDLTDVNFISIDYEKIGDEISSDYLVVEYDGELYFFTNYSNGGRISADKKTPQYEFYIVESNTKKIVSGYPSKEEALAQRKLLVEQYPSMRFELFTLGNLKAKTDLDVTSKSDYVELSTLDKIKKVSVDAYRYGKEKVGQANEFLVRNDVKGKIKRGSKKVYDKTKQGFNWMKRQWEEADFGDGKGKAKFFVNGGDIDLSPREKVAIYNWIENSPIFTADIESNEFNDFDLEKELSKKFDKTVEQSKSIINGYEISRGYSKSKGGKLKYDDGGGVSYRSRDIDKIKIGDIVQYANSNSEYNAEVIDIVYDSQFKGLSSVTIKWLNNGKIQDTYLKDLMLSKGKKMSDGGMAGLSDVSSMLPNPLPMSTIVAMGDGGILGEIYGKKDGGNKIDIFYKTSKGEHHYLNSTNSSKTIKEAVEKYKKILKGDSQTSFAERKRINRLEGKFDDGGVVGQEIVFDDSGERNTGVIREITNLGDYVVATDDDRTVLADRELDVISFGKMRKKVKEVEEKRGFFGLFDEGGDTSKKKDMMYMTTKECCKTKRMK